MAEYPGNASLPAEVKQKILTTFRHTANLYEQGKKDDTVVGCEFILKMDPRFAPAQQLLSAARAGTAVDVGAMLRSLEAPGGAGGSTDLLDRARAALEARDFSGAIALAQQVLQSNPGHAEASEIAGQAQERQEAQPFVLQFVQKARTALDAGDAGEASRQADKAWTIDPTHPELKAVRSAIAEAMAPGSGFDFQGDAGAEIGIGTPEIGFEPAAPESFGFQYAPEEDISAVPVIDLAAPPAAPEPDFAAAAEAPSFSFDAPAAAPPVAFAPPPPPAAAPAPASFSFEEPAAPAAFSFDAPAPAAAPPPPPAAPAAFDFGSATSSDNPFVVDAAQNDKVGQLLGEGDRAYENGDFQGAIDIWSRIFLVDVTSQAASERIDRAKKARAERDGRIEAMVAEANRLWGAGSADEAKAKLAEAMALDPGHAGVRALRESMESGGAGLKAPADSRVLGPSTARPVDTGKDILSDDLLGDFVPPPPAQEEEMYQGPGESVDDGMFPEPAPAPVHAPKKKGLPLPIVLALVGLLVVAGGAGWFLLRPEGGEGGGKQPVAGDILLDQARSLEKMDKFDEAIQIASSVPREDASYTEAMNYVEQLRKKKAAKLAVPVQPPPTDGRPPAEVAAEKKAKGKELFEARKYLEAVPLLDEANRLSPGDPELEQMLVQVNEKITQLQTVLKQFNEGNYEPAIKLLWTMREADKENTDVERLLVNSYFNMGLTELREGTAEKASEAFREILGVRPDDIGAQRALQLSEKYRNKQKDLLYRTFVKHLQPRTSTE